jgi:hypothetical protein
MDLRDLIIIKIVDEFKKKEDLKNIMVREESETVTSNSSDDGDGPNKINDKNFNIMT